MGDPDSGFDVPERPVTDGDAVVPRALVWRLMRDAARRDDEGRVAVRAERDLRSALADEVAQAAHELRRFGALNGPALDAAGVDAGVLEVLADRLSAALERSGVRVEDPVGRRFAEVREWADPLPGGPAAAVDELVVHATLCPAAWVGDRLVRRATVELGRATADGDVQGRS